MKNIIPEGKLCDYGCGKNAKFLIRFKSIPNKYCCESKFGKCQGRINRTKCIGSRNGSFKKNTHLAIKITKSEVLCSYGCNQPAEFKFKGGKFCCCDTQNKCNFMKKQNSKIMKKVKSTEESKERRKNQKRPKQSLKMLNGGAAHANSFIKNPSKPQVELYNRVKELYPSAILNYPCYPFNFSLDVAIPELKICFESDGSWWHSNKEKDLERQNKIESIGWKLIRYYPVDTIKQVPSKEQIIRSIYGES